MPQMMPLNWLLLFMFFSLSFLIFNSLNYFIFLPNSLSSNLSKIPTPKMNWKW
uniref:ATP synthase complex subunit 8 n=1 Tax=Amazonina sp. Z256E TaxID=2093491 RepID=A0A2P1H9Z9_9NEOP|nr:ATP synthase F0 subunit 8 [Amazonina sp. Z256E]